MGAASVMNSLKYNPDVDFVLEDCGYASLKDLIKHKLKQMKLPSILLIGCNLVLKIKFKYTFKEDLLNLVRQNIVNYTSDFAIGYMNEGDVNNLRHRSLYLMCEIIEPTPSMRVYQNPIVVVAKNQYDATGMYNEITGSQSGTMLCEIVNRCDNIIVDAIE